MTYFCIFCWFESSEPFDCCPRCYRQHSELDQVSYTERLILSLQHPEAETRHRVAHILGMRRDIQAIPALAKIADETNDIFLLREIAWALGEMRVSDAMPTFGLAVPWDVIRVALAFAAFGTLIRKVDILYVVLITAVISAVVF